jgi:NADH-quinone oxidoreductase subunit J
MEKFIFYFLAAAIVGFSVMTVTTRKILHAATYLLFVLVATAFLYFLLNYNFLGAVQLTVYSGGVIVLIVFAVLLTARMDHRLEKVPVIKSIIAGLASLLGAFITLYAFFTFPFTGNGNPEGAYDVHEIGLKLVSYGDAGYVLPFEVISILLLAAMIGAIMVAKNFRTDD